MRLIVAGLAVILPFAGGPVLAQTAPREKLISIGPMVGQPSGVTFKMFNQSRNELAWEGGLGWSQSGQDGLQFHAQHQWHLYELKNTLKGIRTFYLGIGGRVKAVDGTRFGVRGSIGINYAAPKYQRRWEAFLELAPIVDLTPDNTTFVDVITGVRFFVW